MMTEEEYIPVADLARVRNARNCLHSVCDYATVKDADNLLMEREKQLEGTVQARMRVSDD